MVNNDLDVLDTKKTRTALLLAMKEVPHQKFIVYYRRLALDL